jgi:hypothetical protein
MIETKRLTRQQVRKLLASEIAVSRIADFMFSIPDPDEILLRAGIRRHQLKSLEMDDEVTQCKETRVECLVSVPWHLEPNQSRAAKRLTEIAKPHVENLMRGHMECVPFGYSVQETMFAKDGAAINVERVSLKPMQWFEPQRDGSLRYFPESGDGGLNGILCDPRKFSFAVRNASYENPKGEALLSRLWFPVTNRREGWGMWLDFLEVFGAPIVIGQVPNWEDFVKAMEAQGVRSTIAWQSSSDLDKVDTITASTPGEFQALEDAITRRVQKLWLGQTMTSGDTGSGGGSYAKAQVGYQVMQSKIRADIRRETRFMQSWFDVLADLNRLPRVRFVMAEDTGLEQARAERDAKLFAVLSGSGYKLTKRYFTDTYDYRDEDIEDRPEPVLPQIGQPQPDGEDNASDGETSDPKTEKPTKGRSVSDPAGREGKAESVDSGMESDHPEPENDLVVLSSIDGISAEIESLRDLVKEVRLDDAAMRPIVSALSQSSDAIESLSRKVDTLFDQASVSEAVLETVKEMSARPVVIEHKMDPVRVSVEPGETHVHVHPRKTVKTPVRDPDTGLITSIIETEE